MRKEKEKLDSQGFANLSASINNVGNSMTGIIKKVAKWGLAIFGVRSAYLAIRQAMSTLSQYDDTMKANIDYIRFALATVLKPIIEWIINAVYKLLSYINYIAKAWFGVDLFANASAKAFGKANKNAQKLQKTMASFDEMNVLSDNRSATDTTATPSFDLSKMQDGQVPEWVDAIAKNKDTILTIVGAVTGLLLAIKGAKILKGLMGILKYSKLILAVLAVAVIVKYYDQIKEVIDNFVNWLDTNFLTKLRELFGPIGDIIYLPIEVAVKSIRTAFESLFGGLRKVVDGIINLFKGNFNEGIKQIFGGLVDIVSMPFRVLQTTVQTVVNRVKEFFKGMAEWLYQGVIKPVGDWFNNLWENISNGARNAWNGVFSIWNNVANWFNNTIISPIKNFFGGMWNGLIDGARKAWEGIKSVFSTVATWFRNIFSNAWQGVINVFRVGSNIFVSIKDAIVNAFKWIVNGLIDGINNVIAIPFNGINSAFDGLRGVDLWGWKPFEWVPRFNVPQIPHLAKGGIINNPGPGVAIGGEKGQEGVLPLTDAQQMDLLGESIARHMVINLTNITELDGRQIARKVEQINNNNNFVLNR